jgi:hypothetical protein
MSAAALEAARRLALGKDPRAMAENVGGSFAEAEESGEISMRFLGSELRIRWPQLDLALGSPPVPEHVLALLVYHLALSDGTEPTGTAISFADLPDGSFYVTAFRGYTGDALARRFGASPDALDRAVATLAGTPVASSADTAWLIPALPRIPITLLWWNRDDEFEPRAELLFDDSASHHLQTDGFAVLGSWLTASLSRAASL